jgi:hypothetical protein
MRKGARELGRLVSVMEKLHRMEELKKLDLERRFGELKRSEEEIIAALNREDALHGLFYDTSSRFLRSLAKEAERVSAAARRQSAKVLEQAGKKRHAERLRDAVHQRELRDEQSRQLDDVVEQYAGQRRASLP